MRASAAMIASSSHESCIGTSRSKDRSASARLRWRRASPRRLDATTVLEETENPFLADFYAGRPGAALQAQLFYLLNRHRQQISLRQGESVRAGDGLGLSVRSRQDLCLPEPRRQRAVHLSAALRSAGQGRLDAGSRRLPAGADRCPAPPAARAAEGNRGRASRSRLPDYLRELNEAYQHFFFHYTATPLLVVETSQFDLAGSDAALDDLIRQIRGMGRGTQYYVPRA